MVLLKLPVDGAAEYDDEGNLISFSSSGYVMDLAEIDSRPVASGGDAPACPGRRRDYEFSPRCSYRFCSTFSFYGDGQRVVTDFPPWSPCGVSRDWRDLR